MSKLCSECFGTGKTKHPFPDICINCDGLGVVPTYSKEFINEKVKKNKNDRRKRKEIEL